ncbi:sulfotransferase 2A1-like [Patiria miniata]|uniref:Sulfotransferase domain-containing protein n=1 Tax=Patiria miniata TaxID=46514 RepID=A0A914A3M1_PATMI|nr:sulfotransferase 2A1-like [Patiria miniata]
MSHQTDSGDDICWYTDETPADHFLTNRANSWMAVVDGTISARCISTALLKDIKEMTVRKDDVWLAAFPKAGTKWCAEIISRVLGFGDSPIAEANKAGLGIPLEYNFPLHSPPDVSASARLHHRVADKWQSPRILTTHLRVDRLPHQIFAKKAKVIYVMRNPKDTLVSFYTYTSAPQFQGQRVDWKTLFQCHLDGHYPGGSWWAHVQGYWAHRSEINFLILTYENMKQDHPSAVRQIADFLEVTLTDEQVGHVVEATSFESMKERAVNTHTEGHYRKGQVGDWKNYFTKAESEAFDEKIERLRRETGITFQF